MSVCMSGPATGCHEGIEENKKKTERKKRGDEKSEFLFSFFFLHVWIRNLLPLPSTSIIVIASEENVRLRAGARACGRACLSTCLYPRKCARVLIHTHFVEEQAFFISYAYRCHSFSQSCQKHWSLTAWKTSTPPHCKGTFQDYYCGSYFYRFSHHLLFLNNAFIKLIPKIYWRNICTHNTVMLCFTQVTWSQHQAKYIKCFWNIQQTL